MKSTEVDLAVFAAVRSLTLGERIAVAIADETFTVAMEPSLGDTFGLMDAPEPTPENEAQAVRALARFLERMIVPEERERFRALLYRLPRGQGSALLMEVAVRLVERVTGFPSEPSSSSAAGRRATGSRAKKSGAGSGGTKTRQRTSRTPSRTD